MDEIPVMPIEGIPLVKTAEARNSGNAVLGSEIDSTGKARGGIEETVVADAEFVYQPRAEDMGLGHSHVLAPKHLGPQLQVVEVPPPSGTPGRFIGAIRVSSLML